MPLSVFLVSQNLNVEEEKTLTMFDDVIGNVRASVTADDCMRGAVDVYLFILRRFGVCNIYNKLLLLIYYKLLLLISFQA